MCSSQPFIDYLRAFYPSGFEDFYNTKQNIQSNENTLLLLYKITWFLSSIQAVIIWLFVIQKGKNYFSL